MILLVGSILSKSFQKMESQESISNEMIKLKYTLVCFGSFDKEGRPRQGSRSSSPKQRSSPSTGATKEQGRRKGHATQRHKVLERTYHKTRADHRPAIYKVWYTSSCADGNEGQMPWSSHGSNPIQKGQTDVWRAGRSHLRT